MKAHSDTPAIFITATDTGVGKTTITAALILALRKTGLRVGVMKPIETGIDPQRQELSDTNRLQSLVSPSLPFPSICLYAFPRPLAPLACAREAGMTIDISRIVSSFYHLIPQFSCLLVEGAGGVCTPITPTHTMRDVIDGLNLPVVIVGRTSLGSINHLLLTLEALQHSRINIRGIVLNEPMASPDTDSTRLQHASTVELIQEWSPVPVFGPVTFEKHVQTDWHQGIGRLAAHPEILRLTGHLIERWP